MSNPINVIKVVKIDSSRGYGNGLFSVIGQTTKADNQGEYTLIPHGETNRNNSFNIYKVHCFSDRETIHASVLARRAKTEAAKRIGLK